MKVAKYRFVVGLFGDIVMKLEPELAESHPDGSSSAFTLPEVLVSILLVSVVVVSLYAGITQGFVISDVSRDNMRATQIMVNTMEVIRLYSWDQINSNGFVPTNYVVHLYPTNMIRGTTNSTSISANRLARVNVRIATPSISTAYKTNMREITIRVGWTNQNVPRFRTMKSYVAREGMQHYVY